MHPARERYPLPHMGGAQLAAGVTPEGLAHGRPNGTGAQGVPSLR
jgi:hypothetical protein